MRGALIAPCELWQPVETIQVSQRPPWERIAQAAHTDPTWTLKAAISLFSRGCRELRLNMLLLRHHQ